jgi:RNA 3'-terminal phosphate cyclase (ATP)
MIQVDGSQRSGSGTIVRLAAVLAAAHGRPVHVFNARARRAKPGLRAQHLATLRAIAELCDGALEGAAEDSREFILKPGRSLRGGCFAWDIGTAGSATMLALGVLPIGCLAPSPLTARITGGVFQDFAPSPFHLQHVLFPLLGKMGIDAELEIVRPGYVPSGGGQIELRTHPARLPLRPIYLVDPGAVRQVTGVALASRLAERHVADRMASACEARLHAAGLQPTIERQYDERATHAGASLAVWAKTSTDCRLGADRAGAPRRTSETIGHHVASALLADIRSGATVDRHLADQLVVFAALAPGTSAWIVPRWTEHLDTNLWLAERFGAVMRRTGRLVEISGASVLHEEARMIASRRTPPCSSQNRESPPGRPARSGLHEAGTVIGSLGEREP